MTASTQVGEGIAAENFALRGAGPGDLEAIVELRADVMRPDLERLGVFDADRVRQRLRDAYEPAHTSVILHEDTFAGSVAMRPGADGWWLEHFYLRPDLHGRGLGGAVLRTVLALPDAAGDTVRLNVLQGSPARRLYERHGFVLESEDPVDVFLVRRPRSA